MHTFDFRGFELRLHSLQGERGEDDLVCLGLYFTFACVLLIWRCPILCDFMLARIEVVISCFFFLSYWLLGSVYEGEAEVKVKVVVD